MAGLSGVRTGKASPKAVPGAPSLLERLLPGLNSTKRIELIIFSRMMATFIRAGIPILDGLDVVRQQSVSSTFRRTLDDVAVQLRAGETLSVALTRHPRVFPRLYVDMIVAAEATGELDTVLDQLARYLERADATSKRVRQAMLYPAIVLCLAAVVVAILTTVVLPSFVSLFADFEAELPLPTQILLAVGSFGGSYGAQTVAVIVGFLALFMLVRDTRVVRRIRQRLILHVPVVGGLAASASRRGSRGRSGSCSAPASPSHGRSTSPRPGPSTRPTSDGWRPSASGSLPATASPRRSPPPTSSARCSSR
jgi:type II secretory pathway component PulF